MSQEDSFIVLAPVCRKGGPLVPESLLLHRPAVADRAWPPLLRRGRADHAAAAGGVLLDVVAHPRRVLGSILSNRFGRKFTNNT
jgi:hypothetical protein